MIAEFSVNTNAYWTIGKVPRSVFQLTIVVSICIPSMRKTDNTYILKTIMYN
jgi:hypothetical protein